MLQKPKSLIEMDKNITKNKNNCSALADRLDHLKRQRPSLAFQNDMTSLETVDKKISDIEKETERINLYLDGAEKERKRIIDKWIEEEEKKLEIEAAAIDKEADELEKKTLDLIAELNKIQRVNIQAINDMNFFCDFKYQIIRKRAGSVRVKKGSVAKQIREFAN